MPALKDGKIYSDMDGHQSPVYAVIQITLFSLQRCRDFQTGKLACNGI